MTTHSDTPSNASEALRHQRMHVKRVGLRYVSEQSRTLEQEDPSRYTYISHGTLSRIERSQGTWFHSSLDTGIIEVLITVLWGGDHVAFERDTGVRPPLHQAGTTPQEAPNVRLPYHIQGEHPTLYQRQRRLQEAPDLRIDFLYQHEDHDMEPTIGPHQLLACRHATHVPPGHAAVLKRQSGLTLAWSAGNGEYLTEQDPEPFRLSASESVYGVVVALQPHRPGLTSSRSKSGGSDIDADHTHRLEALLARHIPKDLDVRKPLTVSCPITLQEQLRDNARRLHIPLQAYLETALEGFLERYHANPDEVPDPLPRPQTADPNFSARMPTTLLHQLEDLTTSVRKISSRIDSPTKAALVLLAYRQLLSASRNTEALEPPTL